MSWPKGRPFTNKMRKDCRTRTLGNTYGKANRGRTHTEETKAKIRAYNIGRVMGPMTDELKEIHRQRMIEFLTDNPNQHVNVKLNKLGRKTLLHRQLISLLSDFGYVEEFPIQDKLGTMYIDAALPNSQIAFEADGSYWHPIEEVKLRDQRLRSLGWCVFHFRDGDFGYGMPNEKLVEVLHRHGQTN
jgi:hypothetical protein